MSNRSLLERYIDGSELNHDKAPVKLPRVWTGLLFAIIGSLWELLDLFKGFSEWANPLPIGSLALVIYWYFCIYRLHEFIKNIEPTYQISPLKATALSVTPVVVSASTGVLDLSAPNAWILLSLFYLVVISFIIIWKIRWTCVESETVTGLKNAKQFAKNCQIARQKIGNLLRQITTGLGTMQYWTGSTFETYARLRKLLILPIKAVSI